MKKLVCENFSGLRSLDLHFLYCSHRERGGVQKPLPP